MLIQMAISRSREFDADAAGAAIAGSPMGLVSALRKLEAASHAVPLDANPATAHMFIIKPFSVSGLMSLFSTHPPTEARVEALLALTPTISLAWWMVPSVRGCGPASHGHPTRRARQLLAIEPLASLRLAGASRG